MNTDATMNVEEYYQSTQHAHANDMSGLPALIRASVFIFVRLFMLFVRESLIIVFVNERLFMLFKFTCIMYKS
jgi:hypothetical protein